MTITPRTVESLTRNEKISLALGAFDAVDGVVPFSYVDGPNGVRGTDRATGFPAALVLAATFDRALATAFGAAVAGEVRAAGANTLLGPAMDIMRVPWGGRSSESFGEDPLLNGELGGTVVAAVQRAGVLCIAKHFVANNLERGRTGTGSFLRRGDAVDIELGDDALHALYLAPFRRAVQRHGLLGLMTSYNRLRGEYVAQNAAILGIPRDWGFEGVTVPDFLFAVRDHAAALAAGLDLPGLDAPSGRTAELVDALDDDALTEIARHVLAAGSAIASAGAGVTDAAGLAAPDARALAEEIAGAGAVLLTNDGLLPFDPGARIAVIDGARADELLMMGGSASVVVPPERVARLEASLAGLGVDVDEVVGTHHAAVPVSTAGGTMSAPVEVVFRDLVEGATLRGALDEFAIDAPPTGLGPDWGATLTASLAVGEPGRYQVTFEFAGELRAELGGRVVTGFREASPMIAGPEYPLTAVVDANTSAMQLTVNYATGPAISIPGTPIAPHLRVGWRRIDDDLARAAAAAAASDAAVVVVGRVTGEAMDAESLRLPDEQEVLLDAVLAAQPHTVVAVLGSGPVVMPWRDRAAAILHLGNAGERGMAALARILTGDLEPRGRMPFTTPADERDVGIEPGDEQRIIYAEGVDVGYRSYDARGIEPAFAFGHGLGFAEISWSDAECAPSAGGLTVSAVATNTSAHDGWAVPQLYVTAGDGRRCLRAFDALPVAAGASVTFTLQVPADDLAEYVDGAWSPPSGPFVVELAASSRETTHTFHVAALGRAE